MKHIYKLFISIYIIFLIFILTSFSSVKLDPISEIFKACSSTPISCGIKLVVNKKTIDMISFLKSFGIDRKDGFSMDSSADCISFKSLDSSGYLEQVSAEDSYIFYFESDDVNQSPISLRNRVLSAASSFSDYTYYVFQKGKISSLNHEDDVLNEIKRLNGDNISYQEITNGWNAVFKIDRSPYKGFIKDNGKFINYQCALMKYKSGNYLIVGSPLISTTY